MGDAQLDFFGTHRRVGPADTSQWRAVAARLPAPIRLGTSSWTFPGWADIVYDRSAPQSVLAQDGLHAYAQHPLLRTVCVDRTLYAPVSTAQMAQWADDVPADFRFVVKAHELCTLRRFGLHERYGSRRGDFNPAFLDSSYAAEMVVAPFVEGLADKGGALLFQLAPQDVASLGGPLRFADNLHRFLGSLPALGGGAIYGVELRNEALLSPRYRDALDDVGAVHCVNVHPTMPDVLTQHRRGYTARTPKLLLRWMLGWGRSYDEAASRYHPFDRLVDEDTRTRDAITALCLRATDALIIVNNKAEGCSPLSITRLATCLAGEDR